MTEEVKNEQKDPQKPRGERWKLPISVTIEREQIAFIDAYNKGVVRLRSQWIRAAIAHYRGFLNGCAPKEISPPKNGNSGGSDE